ncbi:hypothetical protein [Stackebrandtia albiflava]|nr:hypothetical protein [Stackebrandtia albiflava]
MGSSVRPFGDRSVIAHCPYQPPSLDLIQRNSSPGTVLDTSRP